MAAPAYAIPVYVSKGTYGTIYRNFGSEPNYAPEPDVMTKFFKPGSVVESKYYAAERLIQQMVYATFITPGNEVINTAIGVGKSARVKRRNVNSIDYPEANRAPTAAGYYTVPGSYPLEYNTVKLPYLGLDLWGSTTASLKLNLNTFIKAFETFILFHTAFIHNDVKMNNLLYNPANQTVSIIDLGMSKRFASGVNPWANHADYPYHFAYPPDYISINGKEDYKDYYSTASPASIINHNEYTLQFDAWLENANIDLMLSAVWDDYFAGPIDDKRLLWVGVTGDLYGLGVSLPYSMRNADAAVNATEYLVGYNPDGTENRNRTDYIINVLQFLLSHIHPRMRPLDYTLAKYFKTLNPSTLGYEGKTIITIDGAPYTDISILNGAIPSINMASGMAYGMPGSPITADDLKENMIVFAYLLSKPLYELIPYFDTHEPPFPAFGAFTKLQFANVYADAVAYFQQPGFQGIANLIELGIVASLSPLPASAAPAASAASAASAAPAAPAASAASAAPAASVAANSSARPLIGITNTHNAASAVSANPDLAADPFANFAISPITALTPPPQVLPIPRSPKKKQDGGLTKYRKSRKSRRFNITKKRGGRVQARNLVKLRPVRPLEKSNKNTRRNKAAMYGEYQNDLIKYQLLVSRPSGIINVLYKYYLSLSKKPTDYIFRLLLQINEFERDKLPIIQEMCASGKYDDLKEYLEQNFTLNNRDDIDEIIEKYYGFESDDERFYYLNNYSL